MTRLGAALAGAVALCLVAAGAIAQEGPRDVPAGDAVITGKLVHDARADAVVGVGVILYSLSPSGEPGLRQTRTDAAGAFRFEGVSADPGIVYLVGTRVAGVPFGSRVVFAEGEKLREVEVAVSDPATDAGAVSRLESQIRIERGCTHLRLRHLQPLRNDSERVVYVPPDAREGATPLVELLLPEGASQVESLLGDAGEGLERDGRLLRYWGPVYPGTSSLDFGYGVPLDAASELRIGFPQGIEALRVFSPVAGARVSGAGLHPEGDLVLESGAHRALRADPIPPGGELALSLELPTPPASTVQIFEARLWLELDDAALDVSEQYELRVPGPTALESDSDAPLFCLELPPDSQDLRFSDASLDMGLSRDPDGALALHGPIPAGESSLALRYQLPARPGRMDFSRRFAREVPLLTVLVADTGLIPSAERLHSRRPVRTEDRSYLHLEGFGIEPDEVVSMTLEPVPPRRALPALAASGIVLLAGLAALLFLVAPLRGREPVAPEKTAETVSAERQAVYQVIDDLDDDFETGKLSKEDHERMRGELRARAVALLQAERTQKPPAAPDPGRCAGCGAKTSSGDRFCSQCGAPLASGPGA